MEFEQGLKVFFADHGSKQTALAAVRSIRAWAERRNAENVAVARSYLAGQGPFPERAAVLTLMGRFMVDFVDMVAAWADWATTVIEAWPDDLRLAEPEWSVWEETARRELPEPVDEGAGMRRSG
jgi:hypothetical protein